jgi:phosphoribosylformimino-5-aminoimidazole carboxamide ribotide isomerase
MIIIPAIDLKNGQCVRLFQGDFERVTVYSENPIEIARLWQEQGAERIHIVDLDGSLAGAPRNRDVIRNIVSTVDLPVQVGGGIREMNTIRTYIEMGVRWVILGTMALRDRSFVKEACANFRDRIILGVDANNGRIAIQGWTEQTSASAVEIAKSYESYGLAAIVYTDISRDGTGRGVNAEATRALAEVVDIPVIASGGVSDISDIDRILELEVFGVAGVIIGKALYTGAVSLKDAVGRAKKFRCEGDCEKGGYPG